MSDSEMNHTNDGSYLGQPQAARKVITLKQNSASRPYEVAELKQNLEAWKVLLLPVNNLLEWEHKFDPFIILGANTLLFGLLMYYSPSILTTVSVLGLAVLLLESAVPIVTSYFFKTSEWDPISEAKYTRICERLSNFHRHLIDLRVKLENIRKERQSLYFLIVFFFLVFCAYVGQSVDNLFLTYVASLVLTLAPGARRHNLFQKMIRNVRSALGVGANRTSVTYVSTNTATSAAAANKRSPMPPTTGFAPSAPYDYNKRK